MFKLGEYCENDAKSLINYLKKAGFKVDMRPYLTAVPHSSSFLKGKLSELKGQVEDIEKYEQYLAAIKSVLPASTNHEDFRERFLTEVEPSWKEMDELRVRSSDPSIVLSDDEQDRMEKSLENLANLIIIYEFAMNVLTLNDIKVGEHAGEKLTDPILMIRVEADECSPDQKMLIREMKVLLEKVYDVYIDEFSTPLYRDLDEEFRDDFFAESTKIMTLGLLIENLVEEPSEGKMDIESFADERCFLELEGEEKSISLTIDASMVAEDIARVLEKNGVIKIKGDTIKWKAR